MNKDQESKKEDFNKLPEVEAENGKEKADENNPNPRTEKKEVISTKNKLIKAIKFLNTRYDFKFNEITKLVEYKKKTVKLYRYWEQRDYDEIRIEMILNGISISQDNFRTLIGSPTISDLYNPFKEYFNNLTPWDGKTDYIEEFLNQIKLTDESQRKYFVTGVKKWLVGMVVGLFVDEPHIRNQNNICLVFYGGQNIAKSTFLNNFIPDQFIRDYLYIGDYQISGSKDHEEMLGTKWIINLEELAIFNRAEIETVKARITQPQVTLTRRYGKAETRLKRRASFCGATNNKEFITDMTGSRRFLVYDVKDIEENKFPLDKIYSQAFRLWKDGFIFWITKDDTNIVNEHNETFRLLTMEEELTLKHFSPASEGEIQNNECEFYTASDIADYLCDKYKKINFNNTVKKFIGKTLSKYNFIQKSKRINGIPLKVWAVKKVDISIADNYKGDSSNDFLF